MHYVRTSHTTKTADERQVCHLPRNLACLPTWPCFGRFRKKPESKGHYAACAQDALDAILISA